MQLVVDAEKGIVLQRRNDGFGAVDEWVGVGRRGDLGRFEVQHRWQTSRWDWALTFHEGTPTVSSIEALRRNLTD